MAHHQGDGTAKMCEQEECEAPGLRWLGTPAPLLFAQASAQQVDQILLDNRLCGMDKLGNDLRWRRQQRQDEASCSESPSTLEQHVTIKQV